jgi:hypothetical protein
MLVFSDPDMGTRLARLRDLAIDFSDELPRGLDPASSALVESPEGTALLLIQSDL